MSVQFVTFSVNSRPVMSKLVKLNNASTDINLCAQQCSIENARYIVIINIY